MQNIFTGRYRVVVIGVTTTALVIGFLVCYMLFIFGFAYLADFAFSGGGAFSIAFNKIFVASFTLLPGLIAYLIVREAMKGEKLRYSSLSLRQKLFLYGRHFLIMLVVCAGIAYGDFSSNDEFSYDSEPLSKIEKYAVFLRLVMVSILGMTVAYRKFILARRAD